MPANGPSRTFTDESIRSWLLRLSESKWEDFFTNHLLDGARRAYKSGVLTMIDLEEDQAIVTQKVNREELYSVIEWINEKPSIRSSLDDDAKGKILGLAGLYEIEELIAEISEIQSPLLTLDGVEEKKKEDNLEEEEKEKDSNLDSDSDEKKVSLMIYFDISPKKGLFATPFWKSLSGENIRVYGLKNGHEKMETDKPALMHFIAEANKAGFSFEKTKGGFHLAEWNKIAKLCENHLHKWQEDFEIEFGGESKLLKLGQRKVHWEIDARSKNWDTMSLVDRFQLGKTSLGINHSRKLGNARNGTTFLRGFGLVKLDPNQLEDFAWWQRNRGDSSKADWPRYMLFSLFARKYLKARPDGNLAKWETAIRKIKNNEMAKKLTFLRPYQQQGMENLYALHELGCHGLLADEMGLGKTLQTLALFSSNPKTDLPDLVICPASVVPVWVNEAQSFFPALKINVLSKDNLFNEENHKGLWIASYTQLRRHRNLLDQFDFRYAVLDEAQLIKNPKAKVTQTCLSISARHRVALSGTPIENSAMDLWTIFRFLMPGLLGPRKEFENSLSVDPQKALPLLRKQISPFVIRRVKREVAKELPPKIETEIACQLSNEQKSIYKKFTEEALNTHGENLSKAFASSSTHIFALLVRLRQICCDLGLLPDSQVIHGIKGDILLDRLEDLHLSKSKILVFSQFTKYLDILEKRIHGDIPNLRTFKLTGSTRDRAKPVSEFENSRESCVMLASLKAAGLGVNLKSADYVFLMDPWWNPAAEEQAIDRAHRLGRERPTIVYRFVAKGTIEDRVRQLQITKKETFKEIIGEYGKSIDLLEHFSSMRELIEYKEE